MICAPIKPIGPLCRPTCQGKTGTYRLSRSHEYRMRGQHVEIGKPSCHRRYILKLQRDDDISIGNFISVSNYHPLPQTITYREFCLLLTLKHILYVEMLHN